MPPLPKAIASLVAAASLLVTPAMASASTLPAGAASPGAWVTLSQLNPAGAMALGGSGAAAMPNAATLSSASAAAAAQPVDTAADYRPNPFPWPVAVVLLAVVGTAI